MTHQPPADIGRAFFPDSDVSPNGSAAAKRPRSEPKLPALPRRRRPAMLALAVVMAGTGALTSAAVYRHADHSVPVVLVTAPVPAGAQISSSDLSEASVTVSSGIKVIPAAQLGQVVGEIAAVGLRPGTLLAPGDLTTRQPPAPGEQLVPVAVKPGLAARQRVVSRRPRAPCPYPWQSRRGGVCWRRAFARRASPGGSRRRECRC